MLGIIILILKWIGIILATVIGIVLLLLLLILFMPITYKTNGSLHNKLDSLEVQGSAKWFWGLVRVNFEFISMNFNWNWYLLWVDMRKNKDETGEPDRKKSDAKKEPEVSHKTSDETEELEEFKIYDDAKIEFETKNESVKEIPEVKTEKSKNSKSKTKQETKCKNKKKRKINISHTIRKICDKIKMLNERKEKVIEFYYRDIHQHTLNKIKKYCIYILKIMKPKKVNLRAHVGFEDPSTTGKFLAFMSVLYPFYGNTIQIKPDFEDVVYEGDFDIKGFLQIYPFVIVIIRLLIDQKVRETYTNIKNFEF